MIDAIGEIIIFKNRITSPMRRKWAIIWIVSISIGIILKTWDTELMNVWGNNYARPEPSTGQAPGLQNRRLRWIMITNEMMYTSRAVWMNDIVDMSIIIFNFKVFINLLQSVVKFEM